MHVLVCTFHNVGNYENIHGLHTYFGKYISQCCQPVSTMKIYMHSYLRSDHLNRDYKQTDRATNIHFMCGRNWEFQSSEILKWCLLEHFVEHYHWLQHKTLLTMYWRNSLRTAYTEWCWTVDVFKRGTTVNKNTMLRE